VIFYIIELDELMIVNLGSFFFEFMPDFSSKTIHNFDIHAPHEVTKETMSNYTLVYIGDL
jgi:hypothetical protein